MTAQPQQDDINRWHRWFAIECNNQAWDLIGKINRSPQEDQDMIHQAHAAAFHWSRIGEPINHARADVALAYAYGSGGSGQQALDFALKALAFFEANPGEDWDMAFTHGAAALGAAVLGDTPLHASHYERAYAIGAAIQDADDRRIVLEQLALIPRPN